MSYQLDYRASFKKELRKLRPTARRTITKLVRGLAEDPQPLGATKLRASDSLYRIRQGDYRLLYNMYDELVIIELLKVGHRSNVYRSY